MSLSVTFRHAARAEIIEAAAWYESQRPDLGVDFIAEIERCLDAACERPMSYPATRMFAVSLPIGFHLACTFERKNVESLFGRVPRQARPRNLAAPYLRTDQ
jgi:hypothetical protein